ncbi:HNH endonuclease, partial [Desulfurobacterium indicum]
MKNWPVIVLDITYRPFTLFSHTKAFILTYTGRAECLEYYKHFSIKTVNREYNAPMVIKVAILKKEWSRSSPTRKTIFLRDNFRCAYCGKYLKDNNVTVDHIIPKSKEGKWEWENLVTACKEWVVSIILCKPLGVPPGEHILKFFLSL